MKNEHKNYNTFTIQSYNKNNMYSFWISNALITIIKNDQTFLTFNTQYSGIDLKKLSVKNIDSHYADLLKKVVQNKKKTKCILWLSKILMWTIFLKTLIFWTNYTHLLLF